MGATKFPILDAAFLPKMIAECADDQERGMIYLLYYTGMHGSCLRDLSRNNIIREGEAIYIEWRRPKTNKTMRCRLPKEKLFQIEAWLDGRKYSLQYINTILKRIGERAGFDRVSTMTFRHTRCIRALRDEGYGIFEVPHVMGATLDVVARNYTKLREDQLQRGDLEPSQ